MSNVTMVKTWAGYDVLVDGKPVGELEHTGRAVEWWQDEEGRQCASGGWKAIAYGGYGSEQGFATPKQAAAWLAMPV